MRKGQKKGIFDCQKPDRDRCIDGKRENTTRDNVGSLPYPRCFRMLCNTYVGSFVSKQKYEIVLILILLHFRF